MLFYKDLGGIKNKENKTIKKNMILKSTNLNKLKKADIKKLKLNNLSKVIDLRTDTELNEKPDIKIPNVTYLHIPIFNEKVAGITRESESNRIESLKNLSNISDLYKIMVTDEYSILQIKKIINEIVNSNEFSILFHCTAGKDRTGVIAMLVLSILDVDMEDIIKDYLYINKIQKTKANIYYFVVKCFTKNKNLALKAKQFCIADENYIKATMQTICNIYGSVDNFIRNKLNITDEMKRNFKRKILK